MYRDRDQTGGRRYVGPAVLLGAAAASTAFLLLMGTVSAGAGEVRDGAVRLNAGQSDLADGWERLSGGVQDLDAGRPRSWRAPTGMSPVSRSTASA